MADLSQIKGRNVEQQEQIGRRTSIIDDRRQTRAPELEVNANMRTARRGTGSADQLLRALGMVEQAGTAFQDYVENRHAVTEADNIARGAADQAAGLVDDGMMERSLGYRNAVTKGRTVTQFTAATRELDQELRGMIEQQDAPSLEERQGAVSARIEQFYRDFAQDPETGELRDYLQSPGAMRYLAEAIQTSRPQFEANAMSRIEARFNEEALGHYGQNIADQVEATGTVDFSSALSLLPSTVSREEIANTTITSVNNAVDVLRADGRFEEATALLAGLRGYVTAPVDAATATTSGTGGAPSETPAPAPSGTGRIAFDDLAASVMHFESRGNPNAVSPVGAVGTMQTMPGTLRDPGYGVRPAADNSPAELERVGKDYLRAMLREFNGDYVLALAAYNAGPGRVREWMAEGRFDVRGQQAKIDAIPFAETRSYAANVLQRAGGGGGDAEGAPEGAAGSIAPNPQFRLSNPQADPITRFEQSGELATLVGLEGVQFSAEQQARINQLYTVTTNEMRVEWRRQRDEDQSNNASRLALGLFGQGEIVTSEDITRAIESEAITPDAGLTLFRMMRSEDDRRLSLIDRAEARRDRAEERSRRDRTDAFIGSIAGPLLTGNVTPAQARSAALTAAGGIGDSEVARDVLTSILSLATAVENGTMESADVRARIHGIDTTVRDQWHSAITNSGTLNPARQQILMDNADGLIDEWASFYARRVNDGVPEADAWNEATSRYQPRLQTLLANPLVPQR